ncbi:hypothetical protein HYR99_35560 [Candidatus Poribacteria bacterium]|nr:hypothetical protein [Candidatus Poribacteria bacterium]
MTPDALALRVQWAPAKAAEEAGLKRGDILVEADGKTEAMTGAQFNLWIRLTYHPGNPLPIKVLRGEEKISLTIPLQ